MKSFCWLMAVAFAAIGCAGLRVPEFGARYAPANVHAAPMMPKSIRRVALMPLAPHRSDSVLTAGAEQLSGALETELRKAKLFEVVQVSERQLQEWTGRRSWRADEALPQDLPAKVREATGCDAILFATLTVFRPYPPLAVGLDLRLIDCADQSAVWAVDEILDAGDETVGRSARDYARTQLHVGEGEEGAILQSPTRFAQFAAATLMNTLPPREKPLKVAQSPTITVGKEQP